MDSSKNVKKLIVNASIYVANSVFIKAFQFFLVPIYTSQFSTEEYGANNVIGNFVLIMGVVTTLSIGQANARFYAEYKDDAEKVRSYFGSIYSFVALHGLIGVVVLFLAKNLLIRFFFQDIPFFPVVAMALINLWLNNLAVQYTSMLEAKQEAKESAIINFTGFSFTLFFNIVFVAVLKIGLVGVFISSIIVNSGKILFSLYRINKKKLFLWKIDYRNIKDALKYSVPLIPHSLSASIAQFLSRIFISNSLSLASVGVYSLAAQFGGLIDTAQSSVHSAYLPWFFEARECGDIEAKERVKSVIPALIGIYDIVFLGIAFFSKEVIILVSL